MRPRDVAVLAPPSMIVISLPAPSPLILHAVLASLSNMFVGSYVVILAALSTPSGVWRGTTAVPASLVLRVVRVGGGAGGGGVVWWLLWLLAVAGSAVCRCGVCGVGAGGGWGMVAGWCGLLRAAPPRATTALGSPRVVACLLVPSWSRDM